MNFETKKKPKYMVDIESSLIGEKKENGESFFCNIEVIEKSYEENKIHFVTDSNDKILAFCSYSLYNNNSKIDIFCVDRKRRGEGIGKFLISNHMLWLKKNNIMYVTLKCMPKKSRSFWLSVDFLQYSKENDYDDKSVRMYKSTIPKMCMNSDKKLEGNEGVIELWDCEPWKVEQAGVAPKWSWPIEVENDKFKKPIIHPAYRKWNIRWIKNKKVLKESKVKYFCEETKNQSPFLTLTETPKL